MSLLTFYLVLAALLIQIGVFGKEVANEDGAYPGAVPVFLTSLLLLGVVAASITAG